MKSKKIKIQILKKGMALLLSAMFVVTPISYATTSLENGSYLESSLLDKILYGEIGSTVKEIEEYLKVNSTLYIKNETQLRAFAEYVNNGNDCKGKSIVLLESITLKSSEEWVPIGKASNASFKGTFTGNNNTISGLTGSLFGFVGEFGTDELVEVNINKVILNSVFIENGSNLGALVGTSNNANITECKVTGEIIGEAKVGGIIGKAINTVIENCTNEASVKGKDDVGGIVGSIEYKNRGKVLKSLNKGNISGKTTEGINIGGIVGYSNKTDIESCYNEGKILGNGENNNYGSYIGGIVGKAEDVNISKSINNSDVIRGQRYIGGIVGELYLIGSKSSGITDCINLKGLLATNTDYLDGINKELIGGIAGNISVGSNEKIGSSHEIYKKFTLKDNAYNHMWSEISYTDSLKNAIQSIAKYLHDNGKNIWHDDCTECSKYIEKLTEYKDYKQIYQLINGVSEGHTKYYANETESVTYTVVGGYGAQSLLYNGTIANKLYNNNAGQLIVDKKNNTLTALSHTEVKEEGNHKKFMVIEGNNLSYSINGIGKTEEEGITKTITFKNAKDENIATLNYALYKNDIAEALEYKEGYNLDDSIIVKVEFDKLIYTTFKRENGVNVGIKLSKETVPNLSLDLVDIAKNTTSKVTFDKEEEKEVEFKDNKTIVTYTKSVRDITNNATNTVINGQIKNIQLTQYEENKFYYAFSENQDNNYPTEENLKNAEFILESKDTVLDISARKIFIDTVEPYLIQEAYVTELLENNRYTAGKEVVIKVETSEEIIDTPAPKVKVSFSESGTGKYNYAEGEAGYAKCVDSYISIDGRISWIYTYQIQEFDEGDMKITYDEKIIEDLAHNEKVIYEDAISIKDIYADTTAPTVKITATPVANPTNANLIKYTFKFSEKVEGFRKEDITVNNGTAKTFKFLEDVEEYVLEVEPAVKDGNEGLVQVIVEKDVCNDLVGLGNIRAESIIAVDKKAPRLLGLEAYANSDIVVSEDIDNIKQYYKAGEVITIIANFDENIAKNIDKDTNKEIVPTLSLQFSESGNVSNDKVIGEIKGNTIVYTYTIANGDEGTLSVKGFTGKVNDVAGNETKVTKRTLDGDTIIVDTDKPSLYKLKVVTSNENPYNAGDIIKIEAIYSEEIYGLENKEIKNKNKDISPTLMFKFGEGNQREAKVVGYATKEDGSIDKTKIIYTCEVQDGDNGELYITSYENKENIEVCDIAGNTVELNKNQEGTVMTDTKRPEVKDIKAEVEYSIISGIEGDPNNTETGYFKKGNDIKITLTFSEKVNSNTLPPAIEVGFSEESEKEPTTYNTYAYESDWNVNSETVEYTYNIKDGDNGYLWVRVPEKQFKDLAGNTNVAEEANEETNIFADTTKPTLTIYRDQEVIQDGQKITVKATFSENVYNLIGNSRENLSEKDAPLIVYGFGGATGNLEEEAAKVEGNVITYEIIKPNTISGEFYHAYFKGNVYDRAGNECFTNNLDTIAPVLESVEITTNAGQYTKYCKDGTEIYVTATFDEPITEANIKLKVGFEKDVEDEADKIVEISELLDGEILEENSRQVKFTYTVKAGDMGKFTILDVCGKIDDEITEENADKTYGYVQDEHGNQNNIYSLKDEGVTPTGKAEADTEIPYITSIKAIVKDKEDKDKIIAEYSKEKGVITTGKTNANYVEYVVMYSEKVPYNHFEKISITNGYIKEKEYTNTINPSLENYYKEIRIKVQTTTEGVQSLVINEGTVEDKAGNLNEFVKLDAVTVDYTKPTVRFISEYNAGPYVLPTNTGKVEIRPNVEIGEDIYTIEYKWDGDTEYKEIKNYSTSSDIAVPSRTFTEASSNNGYVLHIRVVDLAGNVTETSKTYKVVAAKIDITPDKTEWTKENVYITVSYGEGLTDNRKVTFKAKDSTEVKELKVNSEGKYEIQENGTIFVEATDKVGNKVFTEDEIGNIDKQDPDIEVELESADLIIGTGKDKATIKTDVEVTDNNGVEAKFAYLQEDIDVDNITAEQKAKIANNLVSEAKIENAVSTKDKPYYLYVLAKDNAGNETISKSGPFTVLDSNERISVNEETKEETIISAEISNLITFEQEGKFIDISYNNIIKEKDISLTNGRDGYIDYEYYSYVEVNGATTITVVGKDACGNEVKATYEVTKDSLEGPEFDVIGNLKEWTNQDIKLEVYCYEELKSLTVNDQDILADSSIIITGNGDYKFVATDTFGNTSTKTIKVEKIDKTAPVISNVGNTGKDITVTATDDLSGVELYAISFTNEVPGEWTKSNVIKTTKDGEFYVWARDKAGNITLTQTPTIVDTKAPEIKFNYTLSNVTLGNPIGATIITNEEAKISYSWDNKEWTTSEEYIVNINTINEPKAEGNYTLYAKATDKYGNVSDIQTVEFTVIEEIKTPEIIFEDLATIHVDGVKYVKIPEDMSSETLTSKMNQEALCGKTPEYAKLTENKGLRTGSEITIDGKTKYIIVVSGDVNSDGKIGFTQDIIRANNYRLGIINLSVPQILAADANNDGKIEFIKDIIAINNYRLGLIKSL